MTVMTVVIPAVKDDQGIIVNRINYCFDNVYKVDIVNIIHSFITSLHTCIMHCVIA